MWWVVFSTRCPFNLVNVLVAIFQISICVNKVLLKFYYKIIVCYFTTIFAMLNWSVVSTITSRCRGSYPSYLSILLVGWCASSPDIRVISTPDWATIIMMWSLLYQNGYVISWLVHSLNMSLLWRTISFWHQPPYHYLHIGGCQPPTAGS